MLPGTLPLVFWATFLILKSNILTPHIEWDNDQRRAARGIAVCSNVLWILIFYKRINQTKMQQTAILYGPTKGSVAKVAQLVADNLTNAKLIEVKQADLATLQQYNHLILGLSTIGRANWDSTHTDTDWDMFMAHIDQIDWTGKTVAIFGLGDQTAYPDNFVDAIGWLYDRLAHKQVRIVGHTSPEGYKFDDSEAFREGVFLGLPVDEDNEADLTPARVKNWAEQLKKEGF